MSTLQLQGSFGMYLLEQSITLLCPITVLQPCCCRGGVYSFQTTISLSSLQFATLKFQSLFPYPSLPTSFDP